MIAPDTPLLKGKLIMSENYLYRNCKTELGDVVQIHRKPMNKYLKIGTYIAHVVNKFCNY